MLIAVLKKYAKIATVLLQSQIASTSKMRSIFVIACFIIVKHIFKKNCKVKTLSLINGADSFC